MRASPADPGVIPFSVDRLHLQSPTTTIPRTIAPPFMSRPRGRPHCGGATKRERRRARRHDASGPIAQYSALMVMKHEYGDVEV